jgi:alanyl-tRNA synthetase
MPKFLSADELRKRWIAFFVDRGHKHVASDSLVPHNDPSVLFTGAGMNQFKDNFLGRAKLDHPKQRAVTIQKCLRAGDIDNVGRTPDHHTFFEMLGHFSFGDYFKKESIEWNWKFYTDPEIGAGLEKNRLSVTIFGGDEKLGIPKDTEAEQWWKTFAPELQNADGTWRIYCYGEHDNFWPADAPSLGPNGPCGPCSEMYYDTKPEQGAPEPVANSKDPRRYTEVGNQVFTQFNRLDKGKLEPLSQKNIDMGGGFERLCRVVQGKANNFEIDMLFPIVQEVAKLSGKQYGKDFEDDRRMRRITDHTRAAVFCIADGVTPKNEGRNYVVRRLMRRAILDGRELGIGDPFLGTVAKVVFKQMSTGYPELIARAETLARIIEEEESAFNRTLMQGRQVFSDLVAKVKGEGKKTIPGADAFRLWDTFGFPLELTSELAQTLGLEIDKAGFDAAYQEAVKISQAGSTMSKDIFGTGPVAELKQKFAGQKTEFAGYEKLVVRNAKVLALIQNEKLTESAEPKEEALVLFDRTPFYAESGGQVSDKGILFERNATSTRRSVTTTLQLDGSVQDVQKFDGLYLHRVKLKSQLRVGDTISLEVDAGQRLPTLKNHSGTHLLHNALRSILGKHVEQRGSLVAPDRLRFDFTHFEQIKPDQLAEIERRVNEMIVADYPIETQEMAIAEAKARGAMALFGEKYGERVRVVQMGPSIELCGGTHCHRTGEVGYFRIVSESSVAAGVRRIEALTGVAAVTDARKTDEMLSRLALMLKVKKEAVFERIAALQAERAATERELEGLLAKAANARAGDLMNKIVDVNGTKLLAAAVEGADAAGLRTTLDGIRKNFKDGAVVLGGTKDGKVALLVSVPPELVQRGAHAGNLLKELAPKVGGKGGGKPDMAQGGGTDVAKLPEALESARGMLLNMLNK